MATSPALFIAPQPADNPLAYLPSAPVRECKKDEVLYSPDQCSSSIYMVVKGKVKVYRIAQEGREVLVEPLDAAPVLSACRRHLHQPAFHQLVPKAPLGELPEVRFGVDSRPDFNYCVHRLLPFKDAFSIPLRTSPQMATS